ncbi:MAG: hypothetical protein AAB693_00320 [Patescibacteria group bacterium]
MEQSQYTTTGQQQQPYQQEVKVKAPVFVIIIAWLVLLDGIINLITALPLSIFNGTGEGQIALIQGILLIAVSFGIRRMRRWALYTFTALTALAVGSSMYSFVIKPTDDLTNFAVLGIQALVLLYFWVIGKRFT